MRASYEIALAVALSVLLAASTLTAVEPTTIGEIVFERHETPHPYPSRAAGEPQLVWVNEVHFPGATYIALHFERMEVSPGDFVVVRSLDGKQRWTYTRFGRQDLGITDEGFFATHVKGDGAVIELYAAGDTPGWGYSVDRFGRGYNNDEIAWFWSQGLGEVMNLPYPPDDPESLCGADDTREAKCYQDTEPAAYEASRAVARLLLSGSAHCTGWLVGDAGHLMTNEHCIGSQSTMNNIDFEFMAEGATCATNCATTLGCPGTVEASGGSFIVADAALDYALVVPDTSTGTGTILPDVYGFMRLRESGPVLYERVYHPQHPAGWGKRIAMESTYPEDVTLGGKCYVVSLGEVPCSGGAYDVGYWNDTQGGSSGSPVLAWSDNRVVALHHCRGDNYCVTGNPSTDDPNRGVPIDAVITDLGALLPPGALCDQYAGPATLAATANGDNRVDLMWDPVAGDGITYTVYRALGNCPQPDYEVLASGLIDTNYADTTVSGGVTYAYIVAAFNSEGCESDPSPCAEALATGECTLPPQFSGLGTVVNPAGAQCALELAWSSATSLCGGTVSYNVYRSTTQGFVPDPSNRVVTGLSATGYSDVDGLQSGVRQYYVVRAVDSVNLAEDQNSLERSGVPTGPYSLGTWVDDAGDTGEATLVPEAPWSVAATGGNLGPHVYLTGTYGNSVCAALTTDSLRLGSGSTLTFWSKYQIENSWDKGVVEISSDGGSTWAKVPVNYPGSSTNTSDACGLPTGTYFTGSGTPTWAQYTASLAAWDNLDVLLRFRLSTDGSVTYQGWWVDDLTITNVMVPGDCETGEAPLFADDFESGTTDAWSLTVP